MTKNEIAHNQFRDNTVGPISAAPGTLNRIYDNDGVTTPTAASTAALTLPDETDYIIVSGTADITSIVASYIGRVVTLKFSGSSATTGLVDGSNLDLEGTFRYVAGDTITLVCDGTNWIEAGRKADKEFVPGELEIDGAFNHDGTTFGALGAAPATQHADITDAVVAHALNATFSDTEVEAALDALGVKVNLVLDVLDRFGFTA